MIVIIKTSYTGPTFPVDVSSTSRPQIRPWVINKSGYRAHRFPFFFKFKLLKFSD